MKHFGLIGLLAIGSASALAQQQTVKPRPLGAIQATSKELLGSATLARQLRNGSIIVNDGAKRRLLLLDSTLQGSVIIADSTSGAINGYGQRPGALIPYLADSTLYLDATAGSLLVIDPIGKVMRVMAPPRPADNNILSSTATGFPGFDSKGRMVYRTAYPRSVQQLRDGSIQVSPAADSAPIIRVDLDTRKADTIGVLKLARLVTTTTTMPNGAMMTMNMAAPLPTIDDWALLSDGSIALLRGRDYHIDWILPDGTKKSTAKIPFDWKRLSDDDKLALVDSITKARANMQAAGGAGGSPQVFSFGDGGGTRMIMGGTGRGDGSAPDRVMVAGQQAASAAASTPPASTTTRPPTPQGKPTDTKPLADGAPAPASSAAPSSGVNGDKATAERGVDKIGAATMMPTMPALPAPAASDLPDYLPPFANSSARPDADANLWVRTTTQGSSPGNVVYNIIDKNGELTDRVDVPRGMSIVGFGRGGVVYLTKRDADGLHLVRATAH